MGISSIFHALQGVMDSVELLCGHHVFSVVDRQRGWQWGASRGVSLLGHSLPNEMPSNQLMHTAESPLSVRCCCREHSGSSRREWACDALQCKEGNLEVIRQANL